MRYTYKHDIRALEIKNVGDTLKQHGLTPQQIYNCLTKGFKLDYPPTLLT